MNRNLIVTIVIVVIIAIAGGYFYINQDQNAPAMTSGNQDVEPSVQASASVEKISLKNFMNMAGTQKCQFTDPETGNSGTVYLATGKFRGDFSSNINGKITPSHMINDSQNVYIWMDDQPTGFKTTLQAVEGMSGQTGISQTVDINKEVDYKCSSWVPDPVMFAVPSEIKFQSMDEMVKNMPKMSFSPSASVTSGGNPTACAACDSLDGDAKDQCKRALKCT